VERFIQRIGRAAQQGDEGHGEEQAPPREKARAQPHAAGMAAGAPRARKVRDAAMLLHA
jgi:hypothetical protein